MIINWELFLFMVELLWDSLDLNGVIYEEIKKNSKNGINIFSSDVCNMLNI